MNPAVSVEAFPGNDLLDRGERIDARFFRFDERLANLGVKPHLFIDGFARLLKRDFVSALGFGEGASDHAVVQVEDLVNKRGSGIQQDRHQGGLTTLDLKVPQMVDRGLGAFARFW